MVSERDIIYQYMVVLRIGELRLLENSVMEEV